MMPPPPDFVIAGAAKCGTTALFTYLTQHPAVFMPELKEPGFFSADMPGGIATAEEYYALFRSSPAHCLRGEASTRYLYSRVAIPRLLEHNPAAKVIVMLRNPVEAAYSLHGYAYRYGHENIADFERAWREQAARLGCEERDFAHGQRPIVEYDYRATYHYADQISRIIEYVPPAQRLIFVYEEFFAEPAGHYGRLLDFLGVAPVNPPRFETVNAYTGVRSAKLERALRDPPALLRVAFAPLRPLARAVGLRPSMWVTRLNRAHRPKPPLHPAFRRELERYFSEDVARLESLLQRPLWNGLPT